MDLETKLIIYLIGFALFDIIIPVPITAILMIYVILNKPPWFYKIVSDIYLKDDNNQNR